MGTTATSPANKEATPPTSASASPAATDATSKGAPKARNPLVLFPDDVDSNNRGFEITDPALIQQIISAIQASKPTESFIGDVQGYPGAIDAEKIGKLFAQFSGGGSAASANATPAADPKASAPAPAGKDAKAADTGTAAPVPTPAPAAAKPADQPKTDATKPAADAPPAPAKT
jgi:hypothetical protein